MFSWLMSATENLNIKLNEYFAFIPSLTILKL